MTSDKPRRLKNNQWKSKDPEDLEALWKEHGPAALETVRTYDPGAYLTAIARLVRDVD